MNDSRSSQPPTVREIAAPGGGGDSYGPIRAVLMELLGALNEAAAGSPKAFYDRICAGVCELTAMRRCALLLYDERERRVLPAGSFGIEEEILARLHGTLEETPLAARALAEDRVIVTSALSGAIPARYRGQDDVDALACVPVTAGTRQLGVMLCDQGGGSFDIAAPERDLMWALGKTAALAATTHLAFAQRERAKMLAERVALAREVHDRVIQRLFALSLVLGSGERLSPGDQERAAAELRSALEDLRTAVQRTAGPELAPPSPTLSEEIERLSRRHPALRRQPGNEPADPPQRFEPLAQSVLAEALHNAAKHAHASWIEVSTGRRDGAFELEVRNDGVPFRRREAKEGMGLRLAALDALHNGGVLEFGPARQAEWRVRLVLPIDA